MKKWEDSIIVPFFDMSVGRQGGPVTINSILKIRILLKTGCFS